MLGIAKNTKGKDSHLSLLLPDMDSNHDILNQNQLYYPYTIGQSLHSHRMGCKNRVGQQLFQIFYARIPQSFPPAAENDFAAPVFHCLINQYLGVVSQWAMVNGQ